MQENKQIKFSSFCSGIGAAEEALKQLGINHKVVFACEIDINGYKYGALRHDKQEIKTFAEMQIRFNSNKGIELTRK